MNFDFDVIILGAGPAGSAAAIGCAKRGLCVLIIDAKRSSRSQLGETLHPGATCLFQMLGVSEYVSRIARERPSGFEIRKGYLNRFVPYGFDKAGTWLGYTIWRHTLESILVEQASRTGATVWENCLPTGVSRDGTRVNGVIVNKRAVHARFLIDATGGTRWLSRRLAITYHEYSPTLLAFYGHAQAPPDQSSIPLWDAGSTSWSWTARVEPGVSSWTVLSLMGRDQESRRPAFHLTKTATPLGGKDVSWRMVSRSAGPGFFIVGDAAGLLDPGSSKGALRALISGIKASYFINEVLSGRKTEALAYPAYSDWFRRLFISEAAELAGRYQLLFPKVRWIKEAHGRLQGCALGHVPELADGDIQPSMVPKMQLCADSPSRFSRAIS